MFKNSKCRAFYEKYREQISYLFFGVLTTIVNFGSFALLRMVMGEKWLHIVNIVTFIIATLFAFVTNKLFVFRAGASSWKETIRELITFFGSRISTFCIEFLGLYVCDKVFHVGQYKLLFTDGTMIAKVTLAFVAVILNYFLSKIFVFKKKTDQGDQS